MGVKEVWEVCISEAGALQQGGGGGEVGHGCEGVRGANVTDSHSTQAEERCGHKKNSRLRYTLFFHALYSLLCFSPPYPYAFPHPTLPTLPVQVRCAAAVWLVSLLTYCPRATPLLAMLGEVQEALSQLLGDQNDLTQVRV